MTPLWASLAPVDRNIRKFGHNITDLYTFDKFLGNPSLSPIFDKFPISSIYWLLTQSWLHHNSTSDVCSSVKSFYDASKIKALNHILPCGEILTKHYPDLYPTTDIPCPFCNNQQTPMNIWDYVQIYSLLSTKLYRIIEKSSIN